MHQNYTNPWRFATSNSLLLCDRRSRVGSTSTRQVTRCWPLIPQLCTTAVPRLLSILCCLCQVSPVQKDSRVPEDDDHADPAKAPTVAPTPSLPSTPGKESVREAPDDTPDRLQIRLLRHHPCSQDSCKVILTVRVRNIVLRTIWTMELGIQTVTSVREL